MGMLYNLQKALFGFIGDIKWSGLTHPFWFTINATGYKLKGEHYRKLITRLQPGDIFIRRFEGYIDKWFIPGFWNHAGLYIGDDGDYKEQVIHAVSEGVIQEDVLNFMRTDHMLVLRLATDKKGKSAAEAVKKAKSIVGCPYDFGFDFKDTNRFSCTELVAHCYPGIVLGKKKFGKEVIVADDFFNSDKLSTVWDSRFEDVQQMSVVKSFMAKQRPLKR
jgi:hypothetical protein